MGYLQILSKKPNFSKKKKQILSKKNFFIKN